MFKEKYLEDFKVGEKWITEGRTITETDVVNFSYLTGDWNQLHTNEEFAKKTEFKGRIVQGPLLYAISSGLSVRTGLWTPEALIAYLGCMNMRFIAPVRIGDTIYMESEISNVRTSKTKPDRGIVTVKSFIKKSRPSEVVVELEENLMVRKRPQVS